MKDLSNELQQINNQLDNLYKDKKYKRHTEEQFFELETKLLAKKEEIKAEMLFDLSK